MIELTPARDIEITNDNDQGIRWLGSYGFRQLLQLLLFHLCIHSVPFPISSEIREKMRVDNDYRDFAPVKLLNQHPLVKQFIQEHRRIPKTSFCIRFKSMARDGYP